MIVPFLNPDTSHDLILVWEAETLLDFNITVSLILRRRFQMFLQLLTEKRFKLDRFVFVLPVVAFSDLKVNDCFP